MSNIPNGAVKQLNRQLWVIILLLVFPMTAIYAEVSFYTMLNALKQNSVPLIRFIVATAYVIGIWFVFSAVQELRKVGQSSHLQANGGISKPLIKFIIGIVMIYLPNAIDIGVWTLWGHSALGSGATDYMSYKANPTDPFAPAKEGAIAIVRVVGYVSFVRGLIMLSHSSDPGSQHGTVGKGFMHIIGGILAINIVETIKIISNSLGFITI